MPHRNLGRIARSVKRFGLIGTTHRLYWYTRTLPARRRHAILFATVAAKNRQFDSRHRVETATPVGMTTIDVIGANWAHGRNYAGIDERTFHEALQALPIDYRLFNFVDFGSGKGKALLLASLYPFASICGIEFSPELHQIAQNNITRFSHHMQRCSNVTSTCMDAIEYIPRDAPAVYYFFNPFDDTVFDQVIGNIVRHHVPQLHPVYIIYIVPDCRSSIEQLQAFSLIASTQEYCVYALMHHS